MKALHEINKMLSGKKILNIRPGHGEVVINIEGGHQITLDDSYCSELKMKLNDKLMDHTCLISDEVWKNIFHAFPCVTVNGNDLHYSSKKDKNWVHCKWTEETGLLISKEDVESFDGHDVVLKKDAPCEVSSKDV